MLSLIDTTLKVFFNHLYYALIWSIFAEVIYRLIPYPKSILKIDEKQKRDKAFGYYTSSMVALIHSLGCTLLGLYAYIRSGIHFGKEDYHPCYSSLLYVSFDLKKVVRVLFFIRFCVWACKEI